MKNNLNKKTNGMQRLFNRIAPEHLKQRLTTQVGHIARVFGRGLGHVHLENFEWLPFLAKLIFKASGLYSKGYRNFLDIEVNHNYIRIGKLPESFQDFKILHLSDLHLDIDPAITDAIIKKVEKQAYDLCVLTGDYRWKTHGPILMTEIQKLSAHLKCPFGVYAILGNHDFIEMVPYFEDLNIRMLINESVVVQRNGATIGLAGVDDPHFYGAHDLLKATESITPQAVKILLAHSPELFSLAHQFGYNFYLCGHTHGGQICLPGGHPVVVNATSPRKFARGAWKFRNMHGYTSRGTGSSGIPVRFFCPPEMTIHHLQVA
ncbi:MAG: metallophosphoesterase [Methanosarcinaceae archaeon]